jgi:hypothetical protein
MPDPFCQPGFSLALRASGRFRNLKGGDSHAPDRHAGGGAHPLSSYQCASPAFAGFRRAAEKILRNRVISLLHLKKP